MSDAEKNTRRLVELAKEIHSLMPDGGVLNLQWPEEKAIVVPNEQKRFNKITISRPVVYMDVRIGR